jgi:hypothetical protein
MGLLRQMNELRDLANEHGCFLPAAAANVAETSAVPPAARNQKSRRAASARRRFGTSAY